jgi:O-antigen/teichoic acid export membrane protein
VSLSGQTISGVKWATTTQVARQALRVVTLLVLARIIGPEAYGLVAMALVVTGLIDLFRDLGTSAAIVHRQDADQLFLSSIFWANIVVGCLATIVTFAAAPLVAVLYRNDDVTGVLQALSVSFVISAVAIVQLALLTKELRFRALAAIEVTAAVISSGAAITAGVLGMGAYSLVLQTLSLVAIMSVGAWIANSWRPSKAFDFEDIRSIWGYSSNLVGFNIVNYFTRNADNLLVGRYLGATSLGYYAMAYNVLLLPIRMVSLSIGRVIFPAYASVQDDKPRIARGYLRVTRVVATVAFPVLTGLIVLAEPLVDVVYGPEWAPAATVIMILVPVGLFQALLVLNGTIYQAVGRTDLQFRIGLLWSVLTGIAFVVGLQWGITGVAACYAIASTIIAYPNFAIPLGLIGLRPSSLLAAVWRPTLAAAGMAGAVLGLRLLVPSLETSVVGLATLVLLGIVSYGGLSWIVNRAEIMSIAAMLGISREHRVRGRLAAAGQAQEAR